MITFGDVTFISQDVMRLASFYEAVFGVKAEGDATHAGIALDGVALTFDSEALLKDDGAFGYVSGHSSNNTILSFNVDDVDGHYLRVKALGAALLNEPTTHPWGARSFQFKDPDGNILNFRSPAHP